MSQNPYAPDPYQARTLTPEDERNWSVWTHAGVGLATAVSAGTLGFVAALVVYLMYRDRGPFLRHNAANAMNIQLNMLLWAILGVVLLIVGVGVLILFLVPIVGVVLHVVAAVKANSGEWYNPPMTIRFIR